MHNLAEFQIIGRVGNIERTENRTTVNVCANYRRKDKDGTWMDDPHWNQVTFFGKLAERAAKLETGDAVRLVGTLRQSSYEKDGQRKYTVDLIGDRIGVLFRKNAGSEASDNDTTDDDDVPY